MNIITEILFLTFVGFFHFEGADGFPEVSEDHVVALFTGGAVLEGKIKDFYIHAVPYWMENATEHRPEAYDSFIRTAKNLHFTAKFDTLIVFSLFTDRNNPHHGPTYAELRLKGEHLTARAFHPHTRPDIFYNFIQDRVPSNNQIYIVLPNGAIYASELEKHEAHHRPA